MQNAEYYRRLVELSARSAALWQATVVDAEGSCPAKPGMKLLVPLTGPTIGNLGGGELEHTVIARLRTEQPTQPWLRTFILSERGDQALTEEEVATSMLCGGKVTVFAEPLFDPRRLYVVGAGHCGRALAQLAGLCGLPTCLIDDRREILDAIPPELCSDLRYSDFSDLAAHINFGSEALIVIMTHGHAHDQQALEQCLRQPSRYLGMIGSAAKAAATMKKLEQQGFAPEELIRVHCPAGLPIGSQTPYEIAVSILAQIIRTFSGKA